MTPGSRETYEVEVDRLLLHLDVRHFTASELCAVGARRGDAVLHAPSRRLHAHLIPTIVRVELVRRELELAGEGRRIRITSGYRSPAYNRAVGGSASSLHTEFNAVDLVPLDGPLEALYEALLDLPHARSQFGIRMYRSRGFVHFDTRGFIRPGAPAWIGIE